MEIRNKTIYDKDLIMNYNKYYLNSYIKRNFAFISAISLIFIIYMLVKTEWLYALLLVGILLFYLGVTYLMQKMTTKRILKRSPLVEQPVLQTYIFRDQDFEVANIKSYNVEYSQIVKYRKASNFYLLQSVDRKTYIVDFNGFDSQLDRSNLEEFLSDKYQKKRRK